MFLDIDLQMCTTLTHCTTLAHSLAPEAHDALTHVHSSLP